MLYIEVPLRQTIPNWHGANDIYNYFYKVLDKISHKQYVEEIYWSRIKGTKPKQIKNTNKQNEIIHALNQGNEEQLRCMRIYHYYGKRN